MFDFLIATLVACGGFLAVLNLSVHIMVLADDAEAAYLASVAAANHNAAQALMASAASGE